MRWIRTLGFLVALAAGAPPESVGPRPEAVEGSFAPEEAARLLFPEGVPESSACASTPAPKAVRCWIRLRYAGDAQAAKSALALWDELGGVAGLETAGRMDGGFRGVIALVPELPVAKYRHHLEWVLASLRDTKSVLATLGARSGGRPVVFHLESLRWKFMRSVKRTTPSAYASGWTVAYNVAGSLNHSSGAVRATLEHEIFHLNDARQGDWSVATLQPIFDTIVERCGTARGCLKKYAPMPTTVRGGTYYSFQPGNGEAVREYAAELASRYFEEARTFLKTGKPPPRPFKCQAAENARAWSALIERFFGGFDPSGSCD